MLGDHLKRDSIHRGTCTINKWLKGRDPVLRVASANLDFSVELPSHEAVKAAFIAGLDRVCDTDDFQLRMCFGSGSAVGSDLQFDCHCSSVEVTQIENMLPEPPRIRWGQRFSE